MEQQIVAQKKLTPAQVNHLTQLLATRDRVNGKIEEFVTYLRAEHDCPADKWDINDINVGFTAKLKAQNGAHVVPIQSPQPEETQ